MPKRRAVLTLLGLPLLFCHAAMAITYSDQTVTNQAPPATGCVVPPSVTSFLTTVGPLTSVPVPVYLYFDATVNTSDALSNDWLAPDGSTVTGDTWGSGSGDFCFTGASLNIASLPPSRFSPGKPACTTTGACSFLSRSVSATRAARVSSTTSHIWPSAADFRPRSPM